MSPEPSNHYEEFARDCVRLAQQADTPELRRKLLDLAREWMRASRGETTIPRGAARPLKKIGVAERNCSWAQPCRSSF